MTDAALAQRVRSLARRAPLDELERAAVELVVSADVALADERLRVARGPYERLVLALEARAR